ncbi:MAG: phosphoenolpyruvate mutase [Clostridiaceae bacterium]|nr:phosphoenolpyruvate mutase [Clostridiaceae bacterium]
MKKVYMSFATDIIHPGHINILTKAAELGEVIVGVQSDEAVMKTLRYPLLPLAERVKVIRNLRGVSQVVVQQEVFYDNILRELKPDYVVHGDDWRNNHLAKIRARVIEVLAEWGGRLVEYPYTRTEGVTELEHLFYERSCVPEIRRARLKKLLSDGYHIRVLEAHNGLSALIVEHARKMVGEEVEQYDAIWISSLCDSTIKGKPDIELVDMTSRIKTIEEILEVTTKPIILDGDTGGQIEHFQYNVRTLERIGVSAVIIEDKTGLKKNSLFGNDVLQQQDTIEDFCRKIKAGKMAARTEDFMIFARCESLILDRGEDDAYDRCSAYVAAGADGIMLHSRKKDPAEVLAFCDRFRKTHPDVPIVAVPTTYDGVYEKELHEHGVNVVIYANHLIRSAFPAMQQTAESILAHGRSMEASQNCMSIADIITLIPDV